MAGLASGQPQLQFVNRYRTKDGSYRWLEWRAFPRGDLIYAAARDLTDRIEAEQAVRDSEARYRLMADNTADVIWILDLATMRFTYVSPSVQRLRGYTVREVLEQSIDAVLTPESAERVAAMLPPAIAALEAGDETARINVTEVDQPRKDGSVVATEVTTTLLTNADGRVDRVLGVSRDVAERRQAEAKIRALNESLEARVHERTAQLESAIAELEAFSYSVSHDLRAPLRAINGYATILVEDHAGDIGADGMHCCDNIIGNTRRMGQLIDDLLSFSRLGRSRLAWEPIDMAALAHSAYGEVATEGQRDQRVVHGGRARAGDGRSDAAAAGLGEPAVQRTQVHVGRGRSPASWSTDGRRTARPSTPSPTTAGGSTWTTPASSSRCSSASTAGSSRAPASASRSSGAPWKRTADASGPRARRAKAPPSRSRCRPNGPSRSRPLERPAHHPRQGHRARGAARSRRGLTSGCGLAPVADVATAGNPVLQCLRTEDARWMTA